VQNYLGHEDSSTSKTYQSVNVKLRHDVVIPDDIKVKLSKLEIGEKQNLEEHKDLKKSINQIKSFRIRVRPPGNVAYPQFINPGSHVGDAIKIQMLTELLRKARADGINYTQKDLKKQYRFGSDILTKFWKLIRAGSVDI
jgi:hypothetical protein